MDNLSRIFDGLKDAVEKAIDAGSNYYTLTWAPTNQNWKSEYRKIQIEIARPNLTLAYRHGYFAHDPLAPVQHREPAASAFGPPPYNAIDAAAMRGAPDPTQIIFTASVAPTSSDSESGLAPGNNVNEKTRGPFRRYAVQIGIEAQDLACPVTPDGAHQCALQVKTIVYNAPGTALNSAEGELQTNFTADEYGNVLRSGLHFRQDISVPVSGESFLRIAIRDRQQTRLALWKSHWPTLQTCLRPQSRPKARINPAIRISAFASGLSSLSQPSTHPPVDFLNAWLFLNRHHHPAALPRAHLRL